MHILCLDLCNQTKRTPCELNCTGLGCESLKELTQYPCALGKTQKGLFVLTAWAFVELALPMGAALCITGVRGPGGGTWASRVPDMVSALGESARALPLLPWMSGWFRIFLKGSFLNIPLDIRKAKKDQSPTHNTAGSVLCTQPTRAETQAPLSGGPGSTPGRGSRALQSPRHHSSGVLGQSIGTIRGVQVYRP